jgi:SAM-dependent methyltransferase
MKYMDMLARLGVGSAHPGGFTATLNLIGSRPFQDQARILEVGCGTGRTACHLAKLGYAVTAVDLRPDMLEKARFRAETEEVSIQLVEGNIEQLPFTDGSFDIVLAESVSLFADTQRALSEYARVLSNDGMLYDREMFASVPLDEKLADQIGRYYGIERLWTEGQWRIMLEKAGFHGVELLHPGKFAEFDWQDEMEYPDLGSVVDTAVYMDERIWELTRQYDEIMFQYGDYFGFGVWNGVK